MTTAYLDVHRLKSPNKRPKTALSITRIRPVRVQFLHAYNNDTENTIRLCIGAFQCTDGNLDVVNILRDFRAVIQFLVYACLKSHRLEWSRVNATRRQLIPILNLPNESPLNPILQESSYKGVKNVIDDVRKDLNDVLSLWQKMKTSDVEEAGEDADRFQAAFYQFVDRVRVWVANLDNRPSDVETAKLQSDFSMLFDLLPEPLQIPFETELEIILSAESYEVDSTEQS
jgi:hypothetical protein